MKFKSEFVKAVKLYLLLCLLFWSFTWNSNDLDFSDRKAHTGIYTEGEDGTNNGKNDFGRLLNKHFVEYVLAVRDEAEKPAQFFTILPFNEWKQKEMTKYATALFAQEESNTNKKGIRRKLNYASSKCGAKVLASNPEAKHRNAVLSEKSDEYLLNPCRVRTWFIVELCDTVEATQIDLANYELYSSSPKEFSVFWSDVYPTPVWHLLGSFEVKDQRTVQTFPISTKNLGKFIKVIIYNHHGKEHYCPLSVLRVLGYSMVQKFEDIEIPESIPEYGRRTSKLTNNSIKLNHVVGWISNTFSIKFCMLFLKYCASNRTKNAENVCLNLPMCRFLVEIIRKSKVNCLEYFCLINKSERTTKISKSTAEIKEIHLGQSKGIDLGALKSKRHSVKPTYRDVLSRYTNKQYEISTEKSYKSGRWNKSEEIQEKVKSSIDQIHINGTKVNKNGISKMEGRCICDSKLKGDSNLGKAAKDDDMKDFLEEGESIESAKLIHKDSVLFKLTARIKASERDLNFISNYLQQLSQSYRQQMKDMKFTFDRTLKTVAIASEKANIIDIKQEKNIVALEKKTTSLSRKIDFLMSEQTHLIKKVAELHCFFIILEIIIISTIFTIFLNISHRKRLKRLSKNL